MRRVGALLVAVLAIACTPDTPDNADPCETLNATTLIAPPDKATYIVTFKAGHSVKETSDRLSRAHGGQVKHTFEHAMRGMVMTLPRKAAEALARSKEVAAIEEDQMVRKVGTASWGLDRIDQRLLPLNATYAPVDSGAGVTVYILDTGIRASHSEFGGRVRAGFSAVEGGTEDCDGHGTHVAGTVGGRTFGVAPKVALVPVRVLDCDGSGTNSGVIAGIDWVTRTAVGPSVANMSLGGGASAALNAAVERAVAKGITFVVAAGNESVDACFTSPAGAPNALTVAASTSSDRVASYTNYGRCVDLFAPGSDIRSAYYTGDQATYTMSGTSMASPHVAGAVAGYLGRFPTATPGQIAEVLELNSTPDQVNGASAATPNRLLHVPLAAVAPPPVPPVDTIPNETPVARFDVTCVKTTCSFASQSTDDGMASLSHRWVFGDGTQGVGRTVTHQYARAGSYTVWLYVVDEYGLGSSTFRDIPLEAMCR